MLFWCIILYINLIKIMCCYFATFLTDYFRDEKISKILGHKHIMQSCRERGIHLFIQLCFAFAKKTFIPKQKEISSAIKLHFSSTLIPVYLLLFFYRGNADCGLCVWLGFWKRWDVRWNSNQLKNNPDDDTFS